MIFTRLNKSTRPSSAIAMALVLAATGALGVTALEAPAHAAKKDKKDKDEERKPEYSKEFIAAYNPINEIQSSETPDFAAAAALVPALVATVNSPDEKSIAGRILFNVGSKVGDEDMRLQGIEMMLDSGLLEPDFRGQLNFASYQTYNERNDVAAARAALERAIADNYSMEATMSDGSQSTLGAAEFRRMIANLYFDRDQTAEGLAYVREQVEALKAAGEPLPENLIRSGLSNAYENNMSADATYLVALLAENYPTDAVWGDAVIITLNSNQYANAEILDLLRLSRRMKAYNDARVLSEYVEMLDARRYPGEVVAVIDEGIALGVVEQSDPYVMETRREAAGRVDADKREFAGLAADARAAGADLKTVMVAGDTFLSYDRPADAEEFYTKALGLSGVETPVVLTRLGIAQYDQGKYAEAIETFKKVEGARRDIANLWAIYAAQKTAM